VPKRNGPASLLAMIHSARASRGSPAVPSRDKVLVIQHTHAVDRALDEFPTFSLPARLAQRRFDGSRGFDLCCSSRDSIPLERFSTTTKDKLDLLFNLPPSTRPIPRPSSDRDRRLERGYRSDRVLVSEESVNDGEGGQGVKRQVSRQRRGQHVVGLVVQGW
jgi:hypothetical protein